MKLNFLFKSTDHLRYENGRHVSGPHAGLTNRAVKVEPKTILGLINLGYIVTIYNLDGNHPMWQNNIQMAPKQMKIIEQTNDKVVLRGFGKDSNGMPFEAYGMTVYFKNSEVHKCILHMFIKKVDLEYIR